MSLASKEKVKFYSVDYGFWYTLTAGMANCDLAAFAAVFGSLSGDGNYIFMCDFDADGDVDGSDFYDFINE